jgi:hypothetical protein
MSTYYKPADDVILDRTVGRPLPPNTFRYARAISKINKGEHLYAACDKLSFQIVVCVDDEMEFKCFHHQFVTGQYNSFYLYALDESAHQRAVTGS